MKTEGDMIKVLKDCLRELDNSYEVRFNLHNEVREVMDKIDKLIQKLVSEQIMPEYNVRKNYKGNNRKVKKVIDIWETMTYNEKLEIFTELDEWNRHGT